MTRLRLLSTACGAALILSGSAWAGDNPHRRLAIGGECQECDFSGRNLSGAGFFGADFTEADFHDAELSGARMMESRFPGADFSDAKLVGAQFRGVVFTEADFSDADLTGSSLERVNFGSADLGNADFTGGQLVLVAFSESDLRGAHFRDAHIHEGGFRRAELDGASFRNAIAPRADFTGAEARRINFRDAQLTGAIFTGADMPQADFRGANLQHARLDGADFSNAAGLTKSSLAHACGDDETRLPLDMTLRACRDEPGVARLVGVTVRVENEAAISEAQAEAMAHAERGRIEAMRALEAVIELETGDPHLAREALEEVERELEALEIQVEAITVEREANGQNRFIILEDARRENQIRRAEIREVLREAERDRAAADRARREARRRIERIGDQVFIERSGAGVVFIGRPEPSDNEIWLWPQEDGGYRFHVRAEERLEGAPPEAPEPPAPPGEPEDPPNPDD